MFARPRLLASVHARRYVSTRTIRTAWRLNPVLFGSAVAGIVATTGMLLYVITYATSDFEPRLSPFPEPVAKQLRRALFHSKITPEPKTALKYYRRAIEAANEAGMDPFSDEVLGIKFMIAEMFEEQYMYQSAVDLLELVRNDIIEHGGKDRISKAVGVSVKLGRLYSSEYIRKPELAESRLVWAVESVLKNALPAEETGGTLEALADNYEQANQYHLAAPLYLHAIGLASGCHRVTLMNNLAASLAQQRPRDVASARQWAQKAVELGKDCGEPCAVALHNLGEFTEMDGFTSEAKTHYTAAKELARSLQFTDGIANAEQGLARLAKPST